MNYDAHNRIFPVHVVHHHEFGTDRELIFPGPGRYATGDERTYSRKDAPRYEIVWSAD